MKLSNKQKRALKIVECFVPNNVKDWDGAYKIFDTGLVPYHKYKENGKKKSKQVIESEDGVEPIEAFFMASERGNPPDKVTSLAEFARLMSGHRWMATHEKMYRRDFELCLIHPSDFKDESKEIMWFVRRICESTGRKWDHEGKLV